MGNKIFGSNVNIKQILTIFISLVYFPDEYKESELENEEEDEEEKLRNKRSHVILKCICGYLNFYYLYIKLIIIKIT